MEGRIAQGGVKYAERWKSDERKSDLVLSSGERNSLTFDLSASPAPRRSGVPPYSYCISLRAAGHQGRCGDL